MSYYPVFTFDDVLNLYPYADKSGCPSPKKYPCLIRWETMGGGLGGEWEQLTPEYCPEDLDFLSWVIGKGLSKQDAHMLRNRMKYYGLE